uniref:Nuclear receptor domain-containing protein n=2 Tax=Steinernema glaseri TaxID=37863 RepID=A0A1I8ABB0_9BILA
MQFFDDSSAPYRWSPLSQSLGDIMSQPPDSPSEDASSGSPNPRSTVNTRNLSIEQELNGKACKVCGDRAVGYNFGVISCESCKAFFRRNASRKNEIKCPFTNKCEINQVSRRFCQSCRLKKCLDSGMNKEYGCADGRRGRKHKLPPSSPEQEEPNETDSTKTAHSKETDEIKLSKHDFFELLRKAKEADKSKKKKQCECHCQCGFYSKETKLTAAESSATQSEPTYSNCSSIHNSPEALMPFQESLIPVLSPTPISVHSPIQFPIKSMPPVTPVPAPSIPSHPILSPVATSQPARIPFPQAPPAHIFGMPPSVSTYELAMANLHASTSTFPSTMDLSWYGSPPAPFTSAFPHMQNVRPPSAFSVPQSPMPLLSIPLPPPTPAPINFVSDTRLAALQENDRELLKELVDLSAILRAPIDLTAFAQQAQLRPEGFTFMDVVKISEFALRRIIQHAKEMKHFRKFKVEDQYALIKGSVAELLILRGVMVFNKQEEEWKHLSHGNNELKIKIAVLKQAFASTANYHEHKKFMDTFDEKWRNNELVMLILNAICLFDPQRPRITDKALVEETHRLYCRLLQGYLHTQCPAQEARDAFQSLFDKLHDIPKLAKGLWEIYEKLDPNSVDPLLNELFDISCAART